MFSLGRKEQYIILVILGVIIFGIGVRFAMAKTGPVKPKVGSKSAAPGERNRGKIWVHIAGAVQKPGLYEFTEGERIKNALDKAVPTDKADIGSLNLAELLTDGLKLTVPEKGQVPTAAVSNPSQSKSGGPTPGISKAPSGSKVKTGLAPGEKININTADTGLLDKLPGVGPATAQKIIDYRKANGGFKSIEEIKKIQGIGEKKFNDMKQYIVI